MRHAPRHINANSDANASASASAHGGGNANANANANMKRTREKELENRRLRGQISCAECRRLKLKCDKKVPCSSCVRRGCQTICPNGALSAGHGTRFVLAGSDKLHRKVLEMSSRIRQLEDALQIAHAVVSTREHPLLAAELLKIKNGVDVAGGGGGADEEEGDAMEEGRQEEEDNELDNEVMSSFDTLAISDRGEARFFGRTGTENEPAPQLEARSSRVATTLPAHLTNISRGFPFTSLDLAAQDVLALIEAHLPSWERASALCEAYLENLSWFFRPVDREQIIEELIPSVYKKKRHPQHHSQPQPHTNTASPSTSTTNPKTDTNSPPDDTDFHELAALLMVFSVGAVADLTLEPYNDEAETFFHLSRAAISLQPIFDGASFAGVQAVALMGAYDLFACRKPSLEGSWNMLNLAMLLAASIGLHRDPSRWRLEARVIQRRRRLFWELYSIDNWKGISSGRPTIFNMRIVDCEYPADSAVPFDDGTAIPTFWSWKHRFINEVVSDIADKLGSARAMKYSEILALDSRVREFGAPRIYARASSTADAEIELEIEGATVYLQRTMMCMLREIALLSIHRIFFARAMLEDPDNYPMRSRFAPSFLAAYRSAVTLLKVIREDFQAVSHLMLRLWPIWAHALTASVILGSVAARGRYSSLAPQAFVEFDLAIAFFEQSQPHPVVKSGLPVLHRLRDKAHHALYQYHADAGRRFGIAPPLPPTSSGGRLSSFVTRKTSRDELVVLGGSMSRLLDGPWEEPSVLTAARMARYQTQQQPPLTIQLPAASESAPTSPQRGRHVRVPPGTAGSESTGDRAAAASAARSPASLVPNGVAAPYGAHAAAAAGVGLGLGRRPSGSASPSSSGSEPGGGGGAASASTSAATHLPPIPDWASALSVDALASMATHAEWSALMGLGVDGGAARRPIGGGGGGGSDADAPFFFGDLYQPQGAGEGAPQTGAMHPHGGGGGGGSGNGLLGPSLGSIGGAGGTPTLLGGEGPDSDMARALYPGASTSEADDLSALAMMSGPEPMPLSMPSSSALDMANAMAVDSEADFDVSADMRAGAGVFDEGLLGPLQMGDDATVAEAWRTFFQDSRFFNHDAFGV